jgi:carboxylate-amine ligase
MTHASVLRAFAGYGVELEYMIVDRQTLSVRPIGDELLRDIAGSHVSEVKRGALAWSNELVLHLLELKNVGPHPSLEPLPVAFQAEVREINRLLEPFGARLMPTAMHPWMDPLAETRLWPHDNAAIYRAYDRIFNCRAHGWANLQSMHLNLPFADDEEFARLHAAVRLALPIIPALAASSPIAEGKQTGFLDFRMEAYRTNALRVPSIAGRLIPETVRSRAEYEERILATIYRDIAPFDPDGVLRHEWLNSRAAIPRFERSAIEIRIIDLQECPEADLAIASAITNLVEALYQGKWSNLEAQQRFPTDPLADILLACIRDAEQTVIDNEDYLRLLGYPGPRCETRQLWRHIVSTTSQGKAAYEELWQGPLQTVLDRGPLARRIVDAIGDSCNRECLHEIYAVLCNCLEEGRLFAGMA